MGKRRLAKLTARLPFFGISLVLVLSLVASLTITQPQTAHAATLPAYRYTKTFDTSAGSAHGNGVAIDAQGNVYVIGNFDGTVTFDGTGGSDSQTSSNEDSFLTKYNANGTYAFTKTFDASPIGTLANGQSVATDAQGNVYVTGFFTGTVTFDGTGGSDSQTAAGGNTDTFITKYNANGTYAFTKTFDASASGAFAEGLGVATDAQGNVYVAGRFQNTITFDGTGGSDSQTSSNDDSFLTKYNANGTYAFTKTFDASAGTARGSGVAIDSQGNVYVTGSFNDTVTFDGTGGSDSQTSSNGSAFLTKYNANGTYAFTRSFDTSASGAFAQGRGVAIDTQGNIYVAGYFQGTVTFDGTGGSDSQDAGSIGDAFLTKYNANGSYGYTKTFDASASGAFAEGLGVATDAQNNVYITGDFSSTVTFDGTGGSDSQTAGGSSDDDFFLTKYNANGTYGFTRSFDTTAGNAYAYGQSVVTDAQGNIYVTGQFQDTVVFDGRGGSDSQTAGGGNIDAFLTSFQVFTPGQSSSSAAPAASASVPGAPNTGFGIYMAEPLRTFLLYSLASVGFMGLAIAAQRMKRAKQDV